MGSISSFCDVFLDKGTGPDIPRHFQERWPKDPMVFSEMELS